MVKVNGPMMSMDASGKLADTIVFSKWKGRNYVRNRVIPANPKSGSQVGVRSMFAWLSKYWTLMSAENAATWDDLAAAAVISPFNSFMGHNQERWRNWQSPTPYYPARLGMERAAAPTITATGGVRQVTIAFSTATINENWGIAIMRSTTTGFTPALATVKHVANFWTNAGGSWVDTPLTVGTYYYRFMTFDMGGEYSIIGAEQSATVT